MFMEDVSGFERCDRLDTTLYKKHAFTFPERGMSTEYYMFLEELLIIIIMAGMAVFLMWLAT